MKACPKVFHKKVGNPPHRKWSLNIETADNPPVKICGHPHSPPEHEAICKFIDEGLEDGIIEPSDSSWSAPLILVPKKDGMLRVCVDFRALNRVTKRN
ncbi:DNA/RNA polymerase, partial [Armillaria gallica]